MNIANAGHVQNRSRKIELNGGSSLTKEGCNVTVSTHGTLQNCNGTLGQIKVGALIETKGIVLLFFEPRSHDGESS